MAEKEKKIMSIDDFTNSLESTHIKDIGTAFNIKAYPDEKTIEVFVESGKVSFYTANNPGISLQTGETGVYDKQTKDFKKLDKIDINVISYKTKHFVFKGTRLPEVIEKLNIVYNSKIKLGNNVLEHCTITVTFDNENIGAIASIIGETLGLQVYKTEDGYLLQGNGCVEK